MNTSLIPREDKYSGIIMELKWEKEMSTDALSGENIVPAKKLGMYGIIFTNIEQAKNELKTLRKG